MLALSRDQPFPPISPLRSRCGLIHPLLIQLKSEGSIGRRSRCQPPAIETSKEALGQETAAERSCPAIGRHRPATDADSGSFPSISSHRFGCEPKTTLGERHDPVYSNCGKCQTGQLERHFAIPNRDDIISRNHCPVLDLRAESHASYATCDVLSPVHPPLLPVVPPSRPLAQPCT